MEARAPRSASGQTVLVVEDEDDVRAYTTGILRELGYTGCSKRRTVAAALQILRAPPGGRSCCSPTSACLAA